MKALRNFFHSEPNHFKMETLCYEEGIVSDKQELDIFEPINQGAFGKVYKGIYKMHSRSKPDISLEVAVKEIDNDEMCCELECLMMLREEREIVHLYNYCERGKKSFIVTELCKGGDLIDYIMAHRKFTEEEAAPIIKWLLLAVKKCHDHGICHNDIKLDNIGIFSKDNLLDLKLLDFGKSKLIDQGPYTADDVKGSKRYLAPEIVLNPSKLFKGTELFAIDMWCVGVVAYCLVIGMYPFEENKYTRTPPLKGLSNTCKDFIQSLLTLDPSQRATLESALKHSFIEEKCSKH